jgi:hypothetical protein
MIFAMRSGEVLSSGFACFFAGAFAAALFVAFAGRFFAVVLRAVGIRRVVPIEI